MWELSVYGWQVTPETQMNSSKESAQLEISTVAFQGRVSEKEPGKGTERTFGKVSDKSGKCGVATDKLHVSRTRVYSVSRLPCGPGVKDQEVSFKLNNQRVLCVLDKSCYSGLVEIEQCVEKQERRDEVRSVRGDNSWKKFCFDILMS